LNKDKKEEKINYKVLKKKLKRSNIDGPQKKIKKKSTM
jgi:hypothetical protein